MLHTLSCETIRLEIGVIIDEISTIVDSLGRFRFGRNTNSMDQHRDTIEHVSAWRDSRYICALSDGSRHLGHVVKLEVWQGYDGTHLNDRQNGFRYLGEFELLSDAKSAVERSVASRSTIVMSAGSATFWG
jgi:hypothetical protein